MVTALGWWLKNPHIANLVAHAILMGEAELHFFELVAWVVMPNHVHLLILPQLPVARQAKPPAPPNLASQQAEM